MADNAKGILPFFAGCVITLSEYSAIASCCKIIKVRVDIVDNTGIQSTLFLRRILGHLIYLLPRQSRHLDIIKCVLWKRDKRIIIARGPECILKNSLEESVLRISMTLRLN